MFMLSCVLVIVFKACLLHISSIIILFSGNQHQGAYHRDRSDGGLCTEELGGAKNEALQ